MPNRRYISSAGLIFTLLVIFLFLPYAEGLKGGPASVTEGAVALKDGSIEISWTPADSDTFNSYQLFRNETLIAVISDRLVTSFVDGQGNVIDGAGYIYILDTLDKDGEVIRIAEFIVSPDGDETPPTNPGQITAEETLEGRGGSVKLTWARAREIDLKEYRVYRDTVSGFQPAGGVPGDGNLIAVLTNDPPNEQDVTFINPSADVPPAFDEADGEDAASGEIVIKFKKNGNQDRIREIMSDLGTESSEKNGRKKKLKKKLGVSHFKTPAGKNLRKLLEDLQSDPNVEYAEAVGKIRAMAVVPDDPRFSEQWAHAVLRTTDAWDYEIGSDSVIIAVLDTGCDLNHPDLAANMYVNPNELSGDGLDNDDNGYTDDISGWNFVDDSPDTGDDEGHGTLVAGAAAAAGNNAEGIAGITWHSRIMPLKILDSNGEGVTTDIARALIYAADNGARVINISAGTPVYSNLIKEAVDYAYDKGCVIVASSGNSGTDRPVYPAALPRVIAMGATDAADIKASFSSYGNHLTLTAPGTGVLTTSIGGGYAFVSGTSIAASEVSGAAALLFARYPDLTPYQAIMILRDSAADLGDEGWDKYYGYGRLDAYAALTGEIPLKTEADIGEPLTSPTSLFAEDTAPFERAAEGEVTFLDINLEAGEYYYLVMAVDHEGNTISSAEVGIQLGDVKKLVWTTETIEDYIPGGVAVKATSAAVGVLKFTYQSGNVNEDVLSITVTVTRTDADNDASSYLATLVNNNTSGVALYDDSSGLPGSFIAMNGVPAWGVAGDVMTTTLSFFADAMPVDSGSNHIYYLVIRTSGTISDADPDTFTVGIAGAGDVTFTTETGTKTLTSSTLTADTIAPTATDGNMLAGISTDNLRAGVANPNDVIMVWWDAGADGHTDIALAEGDLSEFGGSATQALQDEITANDDFNGGGQSATVYGYRLTVPAGAIDAASRNWSLTVNTVDNADNSLAAPVSDSSNLSVDNEAPALLEGVISILGTSSMTVAPNDDVYNLTDTIDVAVNVSGLVDAGASPVDYSGTSATDIGVAVAFNDIATAPDIGAADGIWSSQITVAAGSVDNTAYGLTVEITDDAGNIQTLTATTNRINVDNELPTIVSAETMDDDTVHVIFSEIIENNLNEISGALSNIKLAGNLIAYESSTTDKNGLTSTDGAGDLDEFYLNMATAANAWNTDATGLLAGTGTDSRGTIQGNVPAVIISVGALKDSNGNSIASTTFTGTTDAAPPVFVLGETKDDDTVYVKFSEDIENSEDNISAVLLSIRFVDDVTPYENVTITEANSITEGGTSTDGQDDLSEFYLHMTTPTNAWNTNATGIMGIILPEAGDGTDEGGTFRTNAPAIKIDNGILRDANGNNMKQVTFVSASDGARPVLVSAVSQAGVGQVILTWSEAVENAAGTDNLTVSDFFYRNDNAGGGTSIIAMVDADGDPDRIVTVQLDAPLAIGDIGVDDIAAVAATSANGVFDTSGNAADAAQFVAIQGPTITVDFSAASSSDAESASPVLVVILSQASAFAITVDYAATGGTAGGSGADYTLDAGTLSFAVGDTTKTIFVTIVEDTLDEDDETIVVTLSNPTYVILGTVVDYTYTITDNDSPVTAAFSASNSTGDEATTPAAIAVSLAGVSGRTITVDYTATGGTAGGSGVDYTLAAGTLTFSPGDTTKDISVTIVDDTLNELMETIEVTLSNPVNAVLGTDIVHTFTLMEEDVDSDGLFDDWEEIFLGGLTGTGTGDPDEDGLINSKEYANQTDPLKPDTDGDGMPDGWEVAHGLHPLLDDSAADKDGDAITNLEEYLAGTDPTVGGNTLASPTSSGGGCFISNWDPVPIRTYRRSRPPH